MIVSASGANLVGIIGLDKDASALLLLLNKGRLEAGRSRKLQLLELTESITKSPLTVKQNPPPPLTP
jgi:hypothetical protein